MLLFALAILLQSKKCSTPPPTPPQPPPSTNSKPLTIQVQIERTEGSGGVTNGTKYKYPSYPGMETWPETCIFTSNDLAVIKVSVFYLDANSNPVQWGSTQIYTNNNLVEDGFSFYPTLSITAPESGFYWIEWEYTAENCTWCCDANIVKVGTHGFAGCMATPQTNNLSKGRPRFKVKSKFQDWTNRWQSDWTDIEETDISCVCYCL